MTETRGFDLNVFGPFCAIWEPFISALDTKADQGTKPEVKVHDSASQVLKSVLRAELEVMALASRRAQALIHFPVELMTARNPQDLYERSVGFYETAYSQYSESSNKVMSIWGGVAQSVCGQVERTRDYIDFSQPQEAVPQRFDAAERPRHRRAA